MAAAISRASEVRVPSAGERRIMRPNENASDGLDRRKSPANNEANNTSCLKTLEFADFIDHIDRFRPHFDLPSSSQLGPWIEVHLGAVRELPHGGVIAIPIPNSTDDLRPVNAEFQGFYYHSKDHVLFGWPEESLNPHPDQEACLRWASLGWIRWLEHATKPRLMVFESSGFQMKDQNWFEDDVIDTGREGTVKLWFSRHISTSPMSPEHISAEFHILRNSLVLDEQSTRHGPSEAFRCVEIILLHMSSRQMMQPAYSYFPLFYYRISMFRATHLHGTPSRAATTQWRDKGRFPATSSAANIRVPGKPWFFESCISIVARFKDPRDGKTIQAVFIIKDADGGGSSIRLSGKSFEELSSGGRSGFLPTLLREYYRSWEQGWNGCLDGIDDSVKITLEDLSDDTKLDTFMFDGPNFERSRSYFAALQLLRIFSDRIKETRQDLIQAIEALHQDVSPFESTGLKEAESRLLQRIDRKTEEIKTLRDGLFNSTSVREATRATQMNRYVIVFTVVTVLYTPPSFISALFATPLPYFTKGDPDDFKRAVGIATGTTVLAAVILLVIANSFDDVVRNPKDRLISMVESTRTRGWDLLAKSQSFARVALQTVQESERTLREFAGKAVENLGRVGQRGAHNTAPQESRGQTDQTSRGQDIDLPDRTADVATPPRSDHGGNIV